MVFNNHQIDSVIHFAAFKAVGESVSNPLKYYKNNIGGLITLLDVMNKHSVKNIIFSSSATVYGIPKSLPLTEKSNTNVINPYGQTKLMGENILRDWGVSDKSLNIIILRYFNPVGAHKSGLIGEDPKGIPNNLFPYILDVIRGNQPHLKVFGSDYDTPDGTGVRDYIHVVDLAKGHVSALETIGDTLGGDTTLGTGTETGTTKTYNLGTGKGYSVLEIIDKFNQILDRFDKNIKIKYVLTDRREGDSPIVFADCSLAEKELGWISTFGLEQMVIDSLNFCFKD